jgi:iron complex transport system substrate-binding protein
MGRLRVWKIQIARGVKYFLHGLHRLATRGRIGIVNQNAWHNITAMYPPERIVCLTEETVETLYLLGEDRRIVGVSGYAVRPPQVRREKPRVSAFISADVPKILALKPDLVLTFSDLQADIVAELIRANVAVHAFNQRDVAGIFAMIRTLGALVGAGEKADALAASLAARVNSIHERALALPHRPRVYFEEWDEPMISGLGWVSELIEAAGGVEVFPEIATRKNARDRIVQAADVIAARPDIIIGSWCGKKFVPGKVAARPGFAAIPAVANGWLREVKSTLILQPGPAALTDGLDALAGIVADWVENRVPKAS